MSRLRSFVGDYVFPRSAHRTRFRDFALQHPVVFAARFNGRRVRHHLSGFRFEAHEAAASGHLEDVKRHNLRSLWRIRRGRTEQLMTLLTCIDGLDPATTRMLVIGPRNESELLLLSAHGFRLANLVAIDLFSTSPAIRSMDMHSMDLPDDSFDVVYAAYVIAYSEEPARACAEILRVLRDGGYAAFSFVVPVRDEPNVVGLRALRGRVADLVAQFPEGAVRVVWQNEAIDGDQWVCTAIVEAVKSARAS